MIREKTITMLKDYLDRADIHRLKENAIKVDELERKFKAKVSSVIDKANKKVGEQIKKNGKFDLDQKDIEKMLMTMYFDVASEAYKSVKKDPSVKVRPSTESRLDDSKKRLAKKKKSSKKKKTKKVAKSYSKVPSSFPEVMKMWDDYRKKGVVPKRTKDLADGIRKNYLDKTQGVFQQYSSDFRTGGEETKSEIVKKVQEAGKTTIARANTIVETETTNFYNSVRINTYNEIEEVTHYLFVAIRDQATTKWCSTRNGLVYEKGSKYLEDEIPACFTYESPVLTVNGWKPIGALRIGDYVWTQNNRYRKITKIYREDKGTMPLLQIGTAMATANHPYWQRDCGFIEAEWFEEQQGLLSSATFLQRLRHKFLGSVVQKKQEFLQTSMLDFLNSEIKQWPLASQMEWWKGKIKAWIHGAFMQGSSMCRSPWVRVGASVSDGRTLRAEIKKVRNSSPQKWGQSGQQDREFRNNDKLGSHKASQKNGWYNPGNFVYNLEVEEDETYYCGGYLVHNCHWNCRSEMLPLTPLNPSHKKLIDDRSKQRKNRRPEPLPKGWTG